MIKKYIKFNESNSDKTYPYTRVYFLVNSMDDINEIYDYLDSILGFNVKRITSTVYNFPNYIGIPTNINTLKIRRMTFYSEKRIDLSEEVKRFINSNNYDPVILKPSDKKTLKSIIFYGSKIPYIDYNRPKKLVYEGIKHLLNGPSEEEIWNDIKDFEPAKILYLSAKSNYKKGMEIALERGADPTNDSAINSLIESGDVELLDLLVKKGAHIENLFGGRLNDVVRDEFFDMVNYLLDYGLDPNCSMGSALFTAVSEQNYDMVKLLLERGAKANLMGDNLLYKCVTELNREIYQLLKKYTDKELIKHFEIYIMRHKKTHPEWVKMIN